MIFIQVYKLFVYGTLREQECNHFYIEDAKCLDKACWTTGLLFNTGCGYPAMVPSKVGQVFGELYAVTGVQLAAVDRLEDCGPNGDGEYRRITQQIHAEGGIQQAYVYVTCKETKDLKIISSGDWKKK